MKFLLALAILCTLAVFGSDKKFKKGQKIIALETFQSSGKDRKEIKYNEIMSIEEIKKGNLAVFAKNWKAEEWIEPVDFKHVEIYAPKKEVKSRGCKQKKEQHRFDSSLDVSSFDVSSIEEEQDTKYEDNGKDSEYEGDEKDSDYEDDEKENKNILNNSQNERNKSTKAKDLHKISFKKKKENNPIFNKYSFAKDFNDEPIVTGRQTTKFNAVYWYKPTNNWVSYFSHEGDTVYGGRHDNDEACAWSLNIKCKEMGVELKNPCLDPEHNEENFIIYDYKDIKKEEIVDQETEEKQDFSFNIKKDSKLDEKQQNKSEQKRKRKSEKYLQESQLSTTTDDIIKKFDFWCVNKGKHDDQESQLSIMTDDIMKKFDFWSVNKGKDDDESQIKQQDQTEYHEKTKTGQKQKHEISGRRFSRRIKDKQLNRLMESIDESCRKY